MLVVGAGPTGLVLAIELLYRGTSVRVIDKGNGVTPESRAIGLQPRTLEVLDMMGLAERCAEQGHKVRELRFYASGKRLVSLDFARSGRGSASSSTWRRTRPSVTSWFPPWAALRSSSGRRYAG